ncbi:MAG TPA: hypothetical protein VGN14_12785 [Candidatus Elarobacter sp.]|jgi:hypothetical protein
MAMDRGDVHVDESDITPLEQLEAFSGVVEELATRLTVRAKAFGGEVGARPRIDLVKHRLKIAIDELDQYPQSADDAGRTITDE